MKTDNFLAPEEITLKAQYEKQHNCDITVVSLALNRKATDFKTVFLREPSLMELDSYVRAEVTNPIMSKKMLLGTLLIASQEEKKAITDNMYAVMSASAALDEITSYWVSAIKKNKPQPESNLPMI